MDGRTVARRMTSFLVILYGIYMAALLVFGVGLWIGLFSGSAPVGLTLVPAAFGAPGDRRRALAVAAARGHRRGRRGRARARSCARARWFAHSVAGGVRGSIGLLRAGEPGLLGGVAWWGFDIAVLWAAFHAFGEVPPVAIIVMAYFVGTLANTLPLPGGIGGVDGGMIGAFLAFGVDPAHGRDRRAHLPRDRLLAAHASRARSPTSSCAARWASGRPRRPRQLPPPRPPRRASRWPSPVPPPPARPPR